MHIYSCHGQYHASMVSRKFPALRHIEVQGDMFKNHSAKNIFDALCIVKAVNRSKVEAPYWESFDHSDVCSCCCNKFCWHSTLRSEAQGFRDKHNCRMCGKLCCGPCSQKRQALPHIGLLQPVRVCDACFYKGEYAAI
jgi:hypothetical protein